VRILPRSGARCSIGEPLRGSIRSIAEISEQQSAAIEQLSARTEEMSAQVEERAAQAQELASTAEQLRELVARFELDGGRACRGWDSPRIRNIGGCVAPRCLTPGRRVPGVSAIG
jgi:hypothetical protein